MDPVSVIGLTAAVLGVCQVCAQVIGELSKCIDQAKSAHGDVRALQIEVLGLYVILGQLRDDDSDTTASRKVEAWRREFKSLIDVVNETVGEIEQLIKKAIDEKYSTVNGSLVKTTSWKWVKYRNDVKRLTERLQKEKATLSLAIGALSNQKQDELQASIDKIRDAVSTLQDQHVKEKFAVMEKGHSMYENPDLIIHDHRKAPTIREAPESSGSETGPGDQSSGMRTQTPDHSLILALANKSWRPQVLRLRSKERRIPFDIKLHTSTIRLLFANSNIPCVEVILDSQDHQLILNTHRELGIKEREGKERPAKRPNLIEQGKKVWNDAPFWQKVLLAAPLAIGAAAAPEVVGVAAAASYLGAAAVVTTVAGAGMVAEAVRKQMLDQINSHMGSQSLAFYMDTYHSGKIYFPVTFLRVTRYSGRSLKLEPGPDTHPIRDIQGSLEMVLSSPSQTDELETLLRQMIQEATLAWETHCRAFANFDPHTFNISNPAELRASAMREEFRWSVFATLVNDLHDTQDLV